MLLVCEALLMIFPLVVAIYFQGTDISAFFLSILITGLFGVLLSQIKTGKKIMYAVTDLPLSHWDGSCFHYLALFHI